MRLEHKAKILAHFVASVLQLWIRHAAGNASVRVTMRNEIDWNRFCSEFDEAWDNGSLDDLEALIGNNGAEAFRRMSIGELVEVG